MFVVVLIVPLHFSFVFFEGGRGVRVLVGLLFVWLVFVSLFLIKVLGQPFWGGWGGGGGQFISFRPPTIVMFSVVKQTHRVSEVFIHVTATMI